jgi:hypothetical protein
MRVCLRVPAMGFAEVHSQERNGCATGAGKYWSACCAGWQPALQILWVLRRLCSEYRTPPCRVVKGELGVTFDNYSLGRATAVWCDLRWKFA